MPVRLPALRDKLFLSQAVEAHRVVRRGGSHIFWTIGSQMAVRLPALRDKLSLLQAVEVHRVVRRRGSHIF
jgi:hypothetical protein